MAEIYDRFARIYANGPYTSYIEDFTRKLLDFLPELGVTGPARLLDLACGEGSFCAAMARAGWDVTGLDQSASQLELALQRTATEGLNACWLKEDLRTFQLQPTFDLVTCWYDSLNYLLTEADLQKAFSNAAAALKPGGYFIFDMNTIYALTVRWQQEKCYIQQETPDLIEIHRPFMDYERCIAGLNITVFERIDIGWTRFDETHYERGYPLETIEACLKGAGLKIVRRFESMAKKTAVKDDTARVYFVTQRA